MRARSVGWHIWIFLFAFRPSPEMIIEGFTQIHAGQLFVK
jgi:hypothetical protein